MGLRKAILAALLDGEASGDDLAKSFDASVANFWTATPPGLLDGRTERAFLAAAERVGPYLTLARGIAFEQENIRWCDLVLGVLTTRAGHA